MVQLNKRPPPCATLCLWLVLVCLLQALAAQESRGAATDTAAVTTSTTTTASPSTTSAASGDNDDESGSADEDDNKNDNKNDNNDDDDVTAGSRARGGTPHAPLHYLQNLWHNSDPETVKSVRVPNFDRDGYHAGYAIRLSNNTFLAHRDSCDSVNYHNNHAAYSQEPFQWQAAAKIDPHKGNPNGGSTPYQFGCENFHPINHKRMPTGFALHMYDNKLMAHKTIADSQVYGLDLENAWQLTEGKKLHEPPKLQSDPNVKDNCHLYAYSQGRTSHSSQEGERTFSKIHVMHEGCKDNGFCRFRLSEGKTCGHLSDVGAPVMCGGQDKISHVVGVDGDPDKRLCQDTFDALHIAPLHDDIWRRVHNKEAAIVKPMPH